MSQQQSNSIVFDIANVWSESVVAVGRVIVVVVDWVMAVAVRTLVDEVSRVVVAMAWSIVAFGGPITVTGVVDLCQRVIAAIAWHGGGHSNDCE